ncbi:AraC family transcriptional regulator with amidase-like domain [Sinobacterium caligoides]|uniref:AraC family transcriptional regulator with amidase-like domain n=1 Tax=Sinobacterium caligoides TaxID=933926 RepID=A0A3N2DYW5_9GAMM|nr:helix-turn-helix domain-containing protein [Sinobacterium caligoides]ROS05066.1 AraC family transcriptional regulator with amidase-like domain [Sinobacterium caligoides]
MKQINVALLLYEHALASSLSLPAEMLSAADNFNRSRKGPSTQLTITLAGQSKEAVSHSGGILIQPHCRYQQLDNIDLLILPALWRNPIPVVRRNDEVSQLLRLSYQRKTQICSVGTASCFLAEAGLLDNKPATTHWYFMDAFAHRYPEVKLQRAHLITQADNLYCVGSVNSVADLMIHFIEQFYDRATAREVESHFSPEIRRTYKEHSFVEGEVSSHGDESVIQAQQWLLEHYQQHLDSTQLAAHCGLSVRSFNRRFRAAAGMTPGEYLAKVRVDIAQGLLKDSNLSIAEVAFAVGYQDSSHFSRLFKQLLGQPPSSYRKSVRGKLFSLPEQTP